MVNNTYLACQKSGMPLSHARCFQQVANDSRCVISCRSVGTYATGLILESYASKGFRVKAKSCNWGPMAGFVLSDPRFTRPGTSSDAQRKSVHAAIYQELAGEMQVFISDVRRRELETKGCIRRCGGTINAMVYSSTSPGGQPMRFVLQREMAAPGAYGQMWSVSYEASETGMPASPTLINRTVDGRLLPVMALVDPQCPGPLRRTYRAAMTSDYDLWAVFPPAGEFEPHGQDRRPVPGATRFVVPHRTFAEHENAQMGNITERIKAVKNRLNDAIRRAGYQGGDMVHHSDEAGRPMVSEVALEFIAFVPGAAEARLIESLSDLMRFVAEVVRDYHVTLNPGWQRQLGFSATPAGNWEV
jgi:hypothetical protein